MNPAPIKASTQEHLDIEDIRDNLVILKDGSACLILQTTAVNFSLLSEGEQDATIYSYAGLLNSLTFPIQIVIRSQKKDINAYLALLNAQKQRIKNPLLKNQLEKYHQFIQKTVRENEVLDKKFYLVIPFSSLELGISSTLSSTIKKKPGLPFDKDFILQKARTNLIPKRDHLIKQLTRLGLKTKQLTTPELIKLFYQYHNPESGSIEIGKNAPYDAPIVQAAVSKEPPPASPATKPQTTKPPTKPK
jgi:hypothetical protein